MTSPEKYVHACRQAKKNGPGDLSPKILTEAVEPNPSGKESVMTNDSKNAVQARPWSNARKITATMPDGSQIVLKNNTGPTTQTALTRDEVVAQAETIDFDYGNPSPEPRRYSLETIALAKRIIAEHEAAEHAAEARA